MSESIDTSTLIIGAGPAGLAVAGRMRRLGLPFVMLDASDAVASSWRDHYDRLHLHTVKELSHLPYKPFPDDYPRYVSRDQLIAYYEEYARTFSIEPSFGRRVRHVVRVGRRWHVETDDEVYTAENVVIATGANRVPNRPVLEGEDDFAGSVLHSRDYRNPEPFAGRRVLVVGMGNTGAEIALDLCKGGIDVAISVRGPVNIVPRDVLGRPTQLTARLLARLPDEIADRLGTALRRITVGDLEQYGIRTPRMAPLAQLRVRGKTPVIDIGTVDRIKRGEIAVRPTIRCLTRSGIEFADGSEEQFDVVLFATGYRAEIEEIVENGSALLDVNGFPACVVGEGAFEGLFFVGFDNYRPGGVLGSVFEESERVVEAVAERRRSALSGS